MYLAYASPAVESLTKAALLFAVIFALTAIVLAVARRYRGRSAQDKLDPHEMMSNFRELYDRGGLSDEEFRTIKSKLATELKAELKDNSGAG
jgi:preprotein translocase subunit SecG